MLKHVKTIVLATALTTVSAFSAQAAIVSAVDAVINSGGLGFGSIDDTFNQNGLSSNYVSGVTDFDTFVAGTTHSFVFIGNEWFSNNPSSSATVTYDLGVTRQIDKMALWNDEASGIGLLDLLISNDGLSFSSLISGLMPTDNPSATDYAADVFGFAATSFRYIRLQASRCPQPNNTFNSCAIGEVAFNETSAPSPVPVPAGGLLLFSALGGIGLLGRRRKNSKTA